MKITKDNYYTFRANAPVISNSSLKDFERDEYYFYLKHIIGMKFPEAEKNEAMFIGSAFDSLVTDPINHHLKYRHFKSKKDKDDAMATDPNIISLTNGQADKLLHMDYEIFNQEFIKKLLDGCEYQVPLFCKY